LTNRWISADGSRSIRATHWVKLFPLIKQYFTSEELKVIKLLEARERGGASVRENPDDYPERHDQDREVREGREPYDADPAEDPLKRKVLKHWDTLPAKTLRQIRTGTLMKAGGFVCGIVVAVCSILGLVYKLFYTA